MRVDAIWDNARLATLAGGLGLVEDGVVAAKEGRIVYAGPKREAPAFDAARRFDCDGRWITPGLIDCHTHLVYGGDRAREFELRLDGATYEQIAQAGGGIASTVEATRKASEVELIEQSLPRLDALIAEGATTVEIKSGYGLSLEQEQKQLRAARALGERRSVDIVTTFLGAHALPPEAKGDKDAYIARVCDEMLPAIAREGLADAVDAFCEGIAFSPEQVARVFEAAQSARPAREAPCRSAFGSAWRRTRRTVRRACPRITRAHGRSRRRGDGESGHSRRASARRILFPARHQASAHRSLAQARRRHRARDRLNPGTSPLTSLLLVMNMGATLFRLTVEECLAGVTRCAAQALGRSHDIGTLEAGKSCNLAIWNIERPAELVYRMGFNPLHARVWRGE